ncbi:ATPase [Streptococcus hongkongensis]|nr:hypothetical protein NC01_08085 [Streptococcus uberis]
MSDIEQLRAGILEQAHQEGRAKLDQELQILDRQYDQEKISIIAEKKESAKLQLKELQRQYQVNMQQLKNKERQSSLAMKQEVLKELFKAALEKMVNWELDEELVFIKLILDKYTSNKGQVQFGQKTAVKLSEQSYQQLRDTYPNFQFSSETIMNQAGFVISIGQVDYTYLYSDLVDSLFTSECAAISQQLFSED